jgi:hypothetical protein
MLVQSVAIDLASFLKVDWTYCIKHTSWIHTGRIANLPTVTGIMEKVAGTRLTHQPIYGRLVVVSRSRCENLKLYLPRRCGQLDSSCLPYRLAESLGTADH